MKGAIALLGLVSLSFANVCEVNLREHLPFMPERVQVLSKREVLGLCEVVLKDGANVFPLYVGKDFVVAGTMFSKGQNLSLEGISEARKKFFINALPKLEQVVATKDGNFGRTLYMVSDPQCPYCEASKQRAYDLAIKHGWSVALVWYPLPHHKGAKEKAVSFVCEKRTWKDYLQGLYGSAKCEEGERKVQSAVEVLQELGIGGTPTFILSNGKVIEGANFKALEEALK